MRATYVVLCSEQSAADAKIQSVLVASMHHFDRRKKDEIGLVASDTFAVEFETICIGLQQTNERTVAAVDVSL